MNSWQYGAVVDVERPVLIYDGDCAFCTSSVRFIERRMRRHPACQPWQWLDLDSLGVTQEECEQAVQFLDVDGSIHRGERGIARTLIHAGKGWAVIGRMILLPGIVQLAGVVYGWVARNRHRLPGGTAQCSLPASQRQTPAPDTGVDRPRSADDLAAR